MRTESVSHITTPHLARLYALPARNINKAEPFSYLYSLFTGQLVVQDRAAILRTTTPIVLENIQTVLQRVFDLSLIEVEHIDSNSEVASWIRNFFGDIEAQYSYILRTDNDFYIVDQDGNYLRVKQSGYT